MFRWFFFLFIFFISGSSYAQAIIRDTVSSGFVVIEKDERLDILGHKMAAYNESLSHKPRLEDGYRLMLLNTSNRNKVMELRTRLLQLYPDQKVYTVFQSPNIKLKFGNFLDKEEAENMKVQLMSLSLVEGNIYVVPEKVEVKGQKNQEEVIPGGQ